MYQTFYLHSSIEPSVRAVLFGSIAMENTVSQDALLVVLDGVIACELELGCVGVGLVQTHYKLSTFDHVQGLLVSWFYKCPVKQKTIQNVVIIPYGNTAAFMKMPRYTCHSLS